MAIESSVNVTTTAFGDVQVGIERSSAELQEDKPVLVMLHSFATSTKLYQAQFDSPELCAAFNLVAVDEFGHGRTRGVKDDCTFWDQAELVLAVIDKLQLGRVYVLGTSQGGFIAARMALLAPDKVLGIAVAGTSLYSETDRLGSWKIEEILSAWQPLLEPSSAPTPDYTLPEHVSQAVVVVGLGPAASPETHALWKGIHDGVYVGDEGRRKFAMIARSLANRDNLEDEQLAKMSCPVLAMHGTEDKVYSVALMEEWSSKLTDSPETKVRRKVIEGGAHYLAASHPTEVNEQVLSWLKSLKA